MRRSATDSSDERKEEGKAAHRLGDGANKHAERDDVAVECGFAVRRVVAADKVEEALQQPRLQERERVLPELRVTKGR